MNYLILFLSLLFIGLSTKTNTLTIDISNIESLTGTIEIGLYNNGEHFLEEGKTFKLISIKVDANQKTVVIKDLPQGEYAISMYHDVNADGECNLNFLGIPTEPYAFSNNFRPRFSAPTFSDCKFNLNSNEILKIKMGK